MPAPQMNYSRYFIPKQKVSLINMTEGRNREHFESLSGVILASQGNRIEIQLQYPLDQDPAAINKIGMSFKLTSEAMGSGIQVLSDMEKLSYGNVIHLRLRDNLELFQRRYSLRIDTSMKIFHLRKELPLFSFRSEWAKMLEYMRTNGLPQNFVLQDTPVNLSNGGIRIAIEPQTQPSNLSMFVIELMDGHAPVCALAETVWKRAGKSELTCGHRFITIRKADQERLSRHVQSVRKRMGLPLQASKNNWELLDRMTFEEG